MHTVVLIVEHTPSGAMGFVLNRSSKLTLGEVLPLVGDTDYGLHEGGPVDRSTLHYVHDVPERISGGTCFGAGLFIGGDLQEMAALAGEEGREHLRLFLGYSGWGAGQLEEEIELGTWWVAPIGEAGIFQSGDPVELWRSALSRLGSVGQDLSCLPPDVGWN